MTPDGLFKSRFSRLVAAEPLENSARLWLRENGALRTEEAPFRPFMLLSAPDMAAGSGVKYETQELAGTGFYRWRAVFQNISDYETALEFLKKNSGASSAPGALYKVFSDPVQQFLTGSDTRLFQDMGFGDILRFQFDIETLVSPGYDFPNAARPDDSIIMISMSDSTGWEKLISADTMSEKELLQDFVRTVCERDPDVLEGHNIFRFDLPYIETRAKLHKVRLNLGRDGSGIKRRNSRFTAAERIVNYTRYDVFGRHIIDTYFLAQLHDISHRDLDGFGLKHIAARFGVAPPDRTYIEGGEIARVWREDKERLKKYALDDVREARAVSAILSPPYFYQTQLVPMKYQDCAVRGNATCIDAMLCGAVLSQGGALPKPLPPRAFTGALTKAERTGLFKNVWHCDIRSLYPSIILSEKICPVNDHLKIFPRYLEKLREFRLSAKDAARKSVSKADRDYYDAMQSSFKILINSFYGYLGFAQGAFNDFDAAERVTARGREILTMMTGFLEKSGALIIEMDTDGVYFQPPANAGKPESFESKIQSALPNGIEVELDAVYPAMLCHKSKNYALLSESGEITLTGAAMKSRGLEPFQRSYIKNVISLILHEKSGEISALTEKHRKSIAEKTIPLSDLAKTETLNDSLETYKKKISSGEGRRSAAYELALKSERGYRQGDQISFYATGTKKNISLVDNCALLSAAGTNRDENTEYYLAKLEELRKRFASSAAAEPGDFKLE
jgi:DNA polymerase elongation subunit (family B)